VTVGESLATADGVFPAQRHYVTDTLGRFAGRG
jgi:hypothetical protein